LENKQQIYCDLTAMYLVGYSSITMFFLEIKWETIWFSLVTSYILYKLMLHYKTLTTLEQTICSVAANNQLLKGILVMLQYMTLLS